MSNDYQIKLYDPFGTFLCQLDGFISLDYARVVNNVGSGVIDIPPIYDQFIFQGKDIKLDNRIEIRRSINGNSFYLETGTQWFIRDARKILTPQNERHTIVRIKDANDLLHRRIVAYASGSAQSEKTAVADNLIKAIVRENLGSSATDTARSWASYLTVQADLSLAPSIGKAFARRNVLQVLQEVALSSYQAGTYLAFDIVATSQSQLEFRTYIGQRGIDHRWPTSTSPLLFGAEFGNLTDIVRGYDHSEEVTYGYAGGQGQGSSRAIGTASDSIRIGQSPFGRIEQFSDARQTSSATLLADEADMIVKNGLPKNTFEARIIDTPQATYGLHYGFGDYVTAVFEGESIDARIEKIRVQVKDGVETITANIKGNYA